MRGLEDVEVWGSACWVLGIGKWGIVREEYLDGREVNTNSLNSPDNGISSWVSLTRLAPVTSIGAPLVLLRVNVIARK